MKVEITIDTIGDYLYYVMKTRKVGVREVAKATGTSPATISRITSGQNFEIKLIKPLAEWMELTPEKLYELLP